MSVEEGFMFRRRLTTPWSAAATATATATSATASAVSPGAHDLLACDAMTTANYALGWRASLPLRRISTDLAVGASDFHIFTEQNDELCTH
jgi:hypothetical protein